MTFPAFFVPRSKLGFCHAELHLQSVKSGIQWHSFALRRVSLQRAPSATSILKYFEDKKYCKRLKQKCPFGVRSTVINKPIILRTLPTLHIWSLSKSGSKRRKRRVRRKKIHSFKCDTSLTRLRSQGGGRRGGLSPQQPVSLVWCNLQLAVRQRSTRVICSLTLCLPDFSFHSVFCRLQIWLCQ